MISGPNDAADCARNKILLWYENQLLMEIFLFLGFHFFFLFEKVKETYSFTLFNLFKKFEIYLLTLLPLIAYQKVQLIPL